MYKVRSCRPTFGPHENWTTNLNCEVYSGASVRTNWCFLLNVQKFNYFSDVVLNEDQQFDVLNLQNCCGRILMRSWSSCRGLEYEPLGWEGDTRCSIPQTTFSSPTTGLIGDWPSLQNLGDSSYATSPNKASFCSPPPGPAPAYWTRISSGGAWLQCTSQSCPSVGQFSLLECWSGQWIQSCHPCLDSGRSSE